MGNCQAIDNASLVIQNPTTGKSERLYSNISAAEVMKLNPGHYVALLLTTTLYSSRPTPTGSTDVTGKEKKGDGDVIKKAVQPQPLRITRIKLLRPTESLTVGHIYRLV
ncbi:DASH complex subunit DAD4, partial [Tanacetum coccineum]